MNKQILLFTLGLYIASSVLSYATFSFLSGTGFIQDILVSDGTKKTTEDLVEEEQTKLALLLQIDPSEPKDQECPLNGKLYTKTEQQAWAKRRPLAIMIENSPDARPQSGLSDADMVFEALAEGGVTRFMAMYYCGVQKYDTTVAPVRSARSYFVDWASGFNYPLYVHVGGANLPGPANALGQIADYGWNLENDLNQFSIGYPTFVRNASRTGKDVATEHTMETTTEALWEVAEDRDWTNIAPKRTIGRKSLGGDDWNETYKGWSYQEEAPKPGTTTTISYEFWNGWSDYGVEWEYVAETNTYKRKMAGESHIDLNNDKQIEAANVIVLLTTEKGPIDELKHMLYTTTGTGNALVFLNGEVVKATWSKPTRESELVFSDRKGDPIKFARGLTWISVLDTDTEVTY
ncbi:MAG: putative lipoprotein YerB [Patescibacteria group bacterium]|nr:MAG: putative lipoprotein YerB [Patescibacteria group bacterium]